MTLLLRCAGPVVAGSSGDIHGYLLVADIAVENGPFMDDLHLHKNIMRFHGYVNLREDILNMT